MARSKKIAEGGQAGARGSRSTFTDEQKLEAVAKARDLIEDGRSVTQAAKEVGAEYRVSESTVRRWALALGERLVAHGNHERTQAAHEAVKQYTGADYRRAAARIMRNTLKGLDELDAYLQRHKGELGDVGLKRNAALQLSLTRGVQTEKNLIELGFGMDPADEGGGDEEGGDKIVDYEAEANRIRAERSAAREG